MELSCHCGTIKVLVHELPETVLSCNCSICYRYGALWGYYQPNDVAISINDEQSRSYCWNGKNLEFHHCCNCGCMTHYTCTDKVENPKVAVNFRMADHTITDALPVRRFDGAETWKFID